LEGTRISGPPTWQVRVSVDIEDRMRGLARERPSARLAADFRAALDRLATSGTRANGVKKLSSLQLWQVRIGDHRAFFDLVPGSRVIALGALVTKRRSRLDMKELMAVQRRVHRWRDELEAER
jgi:hypothetical protein